MRGQDYRDMMDDVADVLEDVGTVDGEPNITWYHRNHDTYDELYKEDVTKNFTAYKMRGLIFNTRPRLAVTQPGLDTTIDTKVIISPKEFGRYGLTPSVSDRLLVDGVLYNVGDQFVYREGDADTLGVVDQRELSVTRTESEIVRGERRVVDGQLRD
jgi:hypothetical protein